MRRHFRLFLTLLASLILPGGHATLADAPVVTETTSQVPQRKIGEVEVSFKPPWRSRAVKGPWHANLIKKNLMRRLQQTGRRYHADAIEGVTYYPEPTSTSYFRTKEYYARGSLIEYTKFPEPTPEAKTQK